MIVVYFLSSLSSVIIYTLISHSVVNLVVINIKISNNVVRRLSLTPSHGHRLPLLVIFVIVIVMYMYSVVVVLSCAAPQVNWSLSPALAFLVGVPLRCPTSSLSSLLSSQYLRVVIVSYSDVLLYNVLSLLQSI